MKKNICILFMFLAVYLSAFSNNQWEDAISQINEKSLPLVNIDVDVSSLTKANYINGKITIYDYENRVDGNENVISPYIKDNKIYTIDGKYINRSNNYRGVCISNGKKILK